MSSDDGEWIAMIPRQPEDSDGFKRKRQAMKSRMSKCQWCWLMTSILEACIILYLVYVLYLMPDEKPSKPPTTIDTTQGNLYRIYSRGNNKSRVLTTLVRGCNQREHDNKFGVTCDSKDIKLCQTLDLRQSSWKSRDFDGEPKMINVVTTTKSGKRMDIKMLPIRNATCKPTSTCRFGTRLNVYLADLEQKIIGWGGSLTDSSINNILSLSVNGTKRLLDDYFSDKDGLGYNMIRITLGGSDFSGRFYTNDDLEPKTKDDISLEKFRLVEEDLLYKIPMLKYVLGQYKQDIHLLGSMWSPPVWMKTNHFYNKGLLKGSINSSEATDDESYFHALANLKLKFIKAYQRENLNLWGLTVMNEPFFAVQPFLDFNTMIFPPADYSAYIAKVLGPKLTSDESLKNIKLLVHDDNRRFLKNFTDKILENDQVRRYVHGIATHGYVDEDYSSMTEIHEKYGRSIFLLADELCSGHLPFMEKALIGNWDRGVHYALDIIRSLQHRSSGWIDWNMALDVEGGPGWLGGRLDSPIIVDRSQDIYHKSPMFYAIGHFSRYIPAGSVKVAHEIMNDKYDYHFETVTFLVPPNRQLVTVVLNDNPYHVEMRIVAFKSRQENNIVQETLVVCEPDSITTFIAPLPVY